MANRTDQTRRIAISGILAAFSLVLLWLSSVMPTGRWGLIAAAGLLPAAAIISTGLPGGIFCWLTTGILAMILLPDKMNALLYLFLFGLYPIVKYLVERMRKLPIEIICKLLFFNCILSLFWFVWNNLFLPALPQRLQAVWAVFLVGNITFLVYDYGVTKLIGFYLARIAPNLKKR
jgi:hypothetical protein